MLSNTSKYGLKTIMFLARMSAMNTKYTVKQLASELDVPQYFLSKIMQDLSKRNMVGSQKGPGGGFYLTQDHLQKTPYEYLRVLEGDGFWEFCMFESKPCGFSEPCIFHHIFTRYKENFIRELSDKTLRDYA